jgi:hypothetical protein
LADELAFAGDQKQVRFLLWAERHWVVIRAAADEILWALVGVVEAAHRLAGQVWANLDAAPEAAWELRALA